MSKETTVTIAQSMQIKILNAEHQQKWTNYNTRTTIYRAVKKKKVNPQVVMQCVTVDVNLHWTTQQMNFIHNSCMKGKQHKPAEKHLVQIYPILSSEFCSLYDSKHAHDNKINWEKC